MFALVTATSCKTNADRSQNVLSRYGAQAPVNKHGVNPEYFVRAEATFLWHERAWVLNPHHQVGVVFRQWSN